MCRSELWTTTISRVGGAIDGGMSGKDTDPVTVGNRTPSKRAGRSPELNVDYATPAPNMPKTHRHLAQVGWLAFARGIGWGWACRGASHEFQQPLSYQCRRVPAHGQDCS